MLFAFVQRRFAFHAEQDRRTFLCDGRFCLAQVVQGESKILNRNREVQLCAVFHRLSQQLRGRFRHELDVGNQLGDVDVFRRQARAQHVVRVGHHLQRHALQIGMRSFREQEHCFTRIQLHHVQQQRGEQAAVVRIELRNKTDGLPRFTLLALQGGFQHRQGVGFLFTLHVQQAGKQLA